nr:MAG TPA: hypothetical protein [Bacteriophage sp.]
MVTVLAEHDGLKLMWFLRLFALLVRAFFEVKKWDF